MKVIQNSDAQAGSSRSTSALPTPAASPPVSGPNRRADRMHMALPTDRAVLPSGLGMGMLTNLVSTKMAAARMPVRAILWIEKYLFSFMEVSSLYAPP